ncbi:unnamed protein product, partial [Meganyctiphanes norvegica]
MAQHYRICNDKNTERLNILKKYGSEVKLYDELSISINDPIQKLNEEFRTYCKYFDPEVGTNEISAKKAKWETLKKECEDLLEKIRRSYNNIITIAGSEREKLDAEVEAIIGRMYIVEQCKEKLFFMEEFNGKLLACVKKSRELHGWWDLTRIKYGSFGDFGEQLPEERLIEVLRVKNQTDEKTEILETLGEEYTKLLTEYIIEEEPDDETPTEKTMKEWNDTKKNVSNLCEKIGKGINTYVDHSENMAEAVSQAKELHTWSLSTREKFTQVLTGDLHAHVRLNEVQHIEKQISEKKPLIEPLNEKFNTLITAKDMKNSKQAKKLKNDWDEVKKVTTQLCEEIAYETPKLIEGNEKLVATINMTKELLTWATDIKKHLGVGGILASNTEVHPEARYNDAMDIHQQMKDTENEIEPLAEEYKTLISEDETKKSKAAFDTVHEWEKTKAMCFEVFDAVDKECEVIKSDWEKYNEYLTIMGEFEPWIEETEAICNTLLTKPETLEECQDTLDKCKELMTACELKKEAMTKAARARETMAKKNAAENKVGPQRQRLEVVAMHAIERVYK